MPSWALSLLPRTMLGKHRPVLNLCLGPQPSFPVPISHTTAFLGYSRGLPRPNTTGSTASERTQQ